MRARVERRPTTDDADARVRLCRETTGAARFDRAAGGVHRRLKPPSARG
jgi:hypothetical protein